MNCNLHAEKVEGLSLFSLDFPLIFIILNCPTIRLTIEGHGQYLKSRYSGTCPEDDEAHGLAHSLPFVRLHWKVIAVSHQAGSHPDQTASLTPPPSAYSWHKHQSYKGEKSNSTSVAKIVQG